MGDQEIKIEMQIDLEFEKEAIAEELINLVQKKGNSNFT